MENEESKERGMIPEKSDYSMSAEYRERGKSWHSMHGPLRRITALVTVLSMFWQLAMDSHAFDLEFSAVQESRADRRSGFFKPSEVKEASEKKLLISSISNLSKLLSFSI